MTGLVFPVAPTVKGIVVPKESDAYQRHITYAPHLGLYHRSGGSPSAPNLTYVMGGTSDYTSGYMVWSNIGSWVEFDVGLLEPGTWNAIFGGYSAPDRGIARIDFDGVSQGSWDQYYTSGAVTPFSVNGFTVSSTVRKHMRIRFTITGKNTAATSSTFGLSAFWLDRIGA